MKENPFISFYGKNNISPTHQNIDDFRIHMFRREKLYRKMGLPPVFFNNRKILEIGPGAGYNALACLAWGAKMDFVEPNPRSQEELRILMERWRVRQEKWSLFSGTIEEYDQPDKYDAIIAEGFIPGIYNRSEIINKISEMISPGGVVVVTCVDDISLFFEILKRLIAFCFIKDINDFGEKVEILAKVFADQIKGLKFASRSVEDWVTDQFLNPAIHADLFSMGDCILEFGARFEFLGSSPAIFTDLSWYKDVDFDFSKSILKQFYQKRHVLLLWDMQESERDATINNNLFDACSQVRKMEAQYENDSLISTLEKIIEQLYKLIELTTDLDSRIRLAIEEVIALLKMESLDTNNVRNAKNFSAAFGRGQQYVSMIRKFTE